jgi:hypothetical protein
MRIVSVPFVQDKLAGLAGYGNVQRNEALHGANGPKPEMAVP